MRCYYPFLFLLIVTVFMGTSCSHSEDDFQTHNSNNSDQEKTDLSPQEVARQTLEAMTPSEQEVRSLTEYRFVDGEFAFLQAVLPNEGGLSRKLAINGNGKVLSIEQALSEYSQAHRSKWGALTIPLAMRLQEDQLPRHGSYNVWFDGEVLAPSEVQHGLLGHGATKVHVRETKPFIASAKLTPEQLIEVAAWNGITHVYGGSPRQMPQANNERDQNVAVYTKSDPYYTDRNIFATGVKVGITDSLYSGDPDKERFGAFMDDHDAFGHATVEYTHPVTTCEDQSTCDFPCDPFTGDDCYCLASRYGGSRCVTPGDHIDRVSGRVSSSVDGEPLHAAEAHLVIWNGPVDLSVGNFSNTDEIYDTFADKDVHIVNRSLGPDCDSAYTGSSRALNWYSVFENILTVQSAGNIDWEKDECNRRQTVGCEVDPLSWTV